MFRSTNQSPDSSNSDQEKAPPEGKTILENGFTVHEAGPATGVLWAIFVGAIGGVAVVVSLLYLLRKRQRQKTGEHPSI